jgi:hypothetical protein
MLISTSIGRAISIADEITNRAVEISFVGRSLAMPIEQQKRGSMIVILRHGKNLPTRIAAEAVTET